jgi:hypothetical protein
MFLFISSAVCITMITTDAHDMPRSEPDQRRSLPDGSDHSGHITEAPWVSSPATVTGGWPARRLNKSSMQPSNRELTSECQRFDIHRDSIAGNDWQLPCAARAGWRARTARHHPHHRDTFKPSRREHPTAVNGSVVAVMTRNALPRARRAWLVIEALWLVNGAHGASLRHHSAAGGSACSHLQQQRQHLGGVELVGVVPAPPRHDSTALMMRRARGLPATATQ